MAQSHQAPQRLRHQNRPTQAEAEGRQGNISPPKVPGCARFCARSADATGPATRCPRDMRRPPEHSGPRSPGKRSAGRIRRPPDKIRTRRQAIPRGETARSRNRLAVPGANQMSRARKIPGHPAGRVPPARRSRRGRSRHRFHRSTSRREALRILPAANQTSGAPRSFHQPLQPVRLGFHVAIDDGQPFRGALLNPAIHGAAESGVRAHANHARAQRARPLPAAPSTEPLSTTRISAIG